MAEPFFSRRGKEASLNPRKHSISKQPGGKVHPAKKRGPASREREEGRPPEDRFRQVIEAAPEAVVSTDEASRIQFVNAATSKVFGYERSELLGRPLTMLMPQSLRGRHLAGLQRYLETGERRINWQGAKLIGLRKNGEEFPIEVAFVETRSGARRVFTGFIRDISQQSKVEELQADLARRSAIRAEVGIAFASETSSREILSRCAEAIVRHLGAAFARIWTLNGEESFLELQASAGLYTHLDGPHGRVPVGQLKIGLILQEKKPYLINDVAADPRISDKDWVMRESMVAFAGYPLLIEDRAIGVVAMFSRNQLTPATTETLGLVADLTAQCIERKRTEQVLRSTEAELVRVSRVTTMGEIAASVAHEVKQPLAAVVTSASAGLNWLNNSPPNLERAHNAFQRIVREGDRANEVLTRIRALLQKTPLEKKPLHINDVIKEVVAVVKEQLHRSQVSLRTDLADDLPAVLADKIQLQQVLLNLAINAIESMIAVANGPRQLLIQSCAHLLEERAAVLVIVRDTGLGLSDQDAQHVFKAFYTTKPQGMGMGLSISRSIIEAHGGKITARKNDGPGATFQFGLPGASVAA